MIASATSVPGLRARRTDETRQALAAVSRRLTAERGFHGFTVEEVCAEVGVSRRTFFNHFRAKEDAVVGRPADGELDQAILDFIDRGPAGPHLVEELVRLFVTQFRAFGLSPVEAADFIAAVGREPELLQRMIEVGGESERRLVEIVHAREGSHPGDLRAATAVALAMSVARVGADRFVHPDNDVPFDALIDEALTAARELLAAN